MSHALAGTSVLVVEDEPAIAALLEAAIEDCGALVVGPAARVEEALAVLASEHVEVAVLDLIVHGEYCDKVAVELLRRGIPFAVTTAIGADFTHPELQAAPAITKPFQATYVQDVLARLLGRVPA